MSEIYDRNKVFINNYQAKNDGSIVDNMMIGLKKLIEDPNSEPNIQERREFRRQMDEMQADVIRKMQESRKRIEEGGDGKVKPPSF